MKIFPVKPFPYRSYQASNVSKKKALSETNLLGNGQSFYIKERKQKKNYP